MINNYLQAIILFAALIAGFKVVQVLFIHHLEKLAKKTKTNLDDIIIELIKNIKPYSYLFISAFLVLKTLNLSETTYHWLNVFLVVVLTWQIIRLIKALSKTLSQDEYLGSDGSASAIFSISLIVKILIWVVSFLIILSLFGVNISAIVAGLGVGGIAIAFALQNILQDIFSSFSIFIDKPFVVGDMIVIGTDIGTVERIGIKSTRIKTLQGEELVVSNKELTSTRVHNYKKMIDRRVVFSFQLIYRTNPEKLREVPKIIKEIIENTPSTRFDRAHFKEYGDFSLKFEVVYYVASADYTRYMDIQQAINLAIFEKFAEKNIEFAYPTQNIIMQK